MQHVFSVASKFHQGKIILNWRGRHWFNIDATAIQLNQDFGNQYHYFTEELDPQFPKPLIPRMDINISVDNDH